MWHGAWIRKIFFYKHGSLEIDMTTKRRSDITPTITSSPSSHSSAFSLPTPLSEIWRLAAQLLPRGYPGV